ncbi:MAG TPA: alkaline phosphatase family protein, partial [Candidatus Acidoferrales bacterium]|nr:alkaline phosphatase family protein [Candidatus Acidoferrales bacterium]
MQRTAPAVLALCIAAAGCSASFSGAPYAGAPASFARPAAARSASPIRHVVIVLQENRSFDNLFAGFPGADAPMTGRLPNGQTIALHPEGLVTTDVCHSFVNAIDDYDGGAMDGFAGNCTGNGKSGTFDYAYVRRNLVEPYWSMARQYALADRMFPTMMGPSWTAHLTAVAGTADLNATTSLIDLPSDHPWGCDAPPGTTTVTYTVQHVVDRYGPFPCLTQFRTLADTLDAAGVSWRYYAPPIADGGIWTAFDAIKRVRYGADWKRDVVSPSPRFLTDVAAGKLAGVTWVIPDWKYSDHAPGGNLGPSWVSAVVNAVGTSRFWQSTAVIVMWDDWGGWYDDAPPPQLDFRGLGLRVPCIVISPYVKRHYVSHTQYEFGSAIKFVEETFGLPPLGTAAE